MKHTHAPLAASIVFLSLAAAICPVAGAFSLEDCQALARRNAPPVAGAAADVARGERAVREAQAALRPTLRLNGFYLQNNEAPKVLFTLPGTGLSQVIKTGSANTLDLRTEAQYTLSSGGRNAALVRAAEASSGALQRAREQAEADVLLRVSQAYYREVAARRLEAAAREALGSSQTHLRVSQARVRAGVVPAVDALRAQADEAQRRSAALRAADAVRLARVDLETAVGAPLDPSDAPREPGPPPAEAVPDSAAALASALASRPELAGLEEQIRQSAEQARAARATRSPQLALSGTAEYRGPNQNGGYLNFTDPGLKTYNLSAMLGLSMPIFDGGLAEARAGEAEAQQASLTARRRDTELAIHREVEQALSGLRVAAAVWQADSSRVAFSREALRQAEAGYKGGTGTATDVRDAEAALADARAEEARSLTDYWAAHSALEHATGSSVARKER